MDEFEESALELFDEKERTIRNFTINIVKENKKKYALRFLRSMITIYKSYENEDFVKSIFAFYSLVINLTEFPQMKLDVIHETQEFLTEYGGEGLSLMDLAILEVEHLMILGKIEDALVLVLETIAETGSLVLNSNDDEFQDEESKIDFKEMANSILARGYLWLGKIYIDIGDQRKGFKSSATANKYANKMEEGENKEKLISKINTQQSKALNDDDGFDFNYEPKKKNKFNMKASVQRLHKGVGGEKKGFHYDCCPNLVFIRENAFERIKLHGPEGKMKESMDRLYKGQKYYDPEIIVKSQPFKNYSRQGFLPATDHYGYKPKDYPQCSIENSPYYKEGNKRDRIDLIHTVKFKPIKIDTNIGTISMDNKESYRNKEQSMRISARKSVNIIRDSGGKPFGGGNQSQISAGRRRNQFLDALSND